MKGKQTRIDRKYLKISLYALFVLIIAILFEKVAANLSDVAGSLQSAYRFLMGLIQPFIIGFAIAYLLNPSMKILEKYLKFQPFFKKRPQFARSAAILVNYLIVIGCILWCSFVFLPEIKDSVLKFIQQAPDYMSAMNDQIKEIFNQITFIDSSDVIDGVNRVFNPLLEFSEDIPQLIATIAGNVYNFGVLALNVIMGIFIAFYMLMEKENFRKSSQKVLYALWSEEKADRFIYNLQRTHSIFQSFIVGKAVDSFIIGILAFIGFHILKNPFAAALAFFVGLTNMIPYFGPFIGAIPSILITFLVSPLQAVAVGIFILILQQFDGNYLGPKILGDKLDISPLWIILSIIVGGALMGAVGMFIGVPIFATIRLFCMEAIDRRFAGKYSRRNPLEKYANESDTEEKELAVLIREALDQAPTDYPKI